MAGDASQRAAHTFLLEHLQTQEAYTLEEFGAATGWLKPGTINTYLHKQFRGLMEETPMERTA